MKITKTQLKRIIKEELGRVLENDLDDESFRYAEGRGKDELEKITLYLTMEYEEDVGELIMGRPQSHHRPWQGVPETHHMLTELAQIVFDEYKTLENAYNTMVDVPDAAGRSWPLPGIKAVARNYFKEKRENYESKEI